MGHFVVGENVLPMDIQDVEREDNVDAPETLPGTPCI